MELSFTRDLFSHGSFHLIVPILPISQTMLRLMIENYNQDLWHHPYFTRYLLKSNSH